MTELITITEQNGQRAVSARELYKFLEVTERFSNWFERQLQYGFTENIDYQGCKIFNTQANQELTDYALSIDCAKEISMLQRTEKGKLARLYFIEMEKKAKEPQANAIGYGAKINALPRAERERAIIDSVKEERFELAELQAVAQEYLNKNSRQRFIYAVEPDQLYLKSIRANLTLGQTIRLKDIDFELDKDIRVVSLTKDLQNPYKIAFEVAEQATITQIVRNYIEREKKETAIKKEQKQNAEMARRSWLFAEEIKNNVFDPEGFFDMQKIKPLSIDTAHINIGARSQQFSLPNVAFTLSANQRRLKNTAGKMEHLTINENAPRTWFIAQNETPEFSTNFNYIYLKAQKQGSNAVFIVTEQKLMLDADPIFYYFLVGFVSSVIDGVRRIKTSYGFTQITPSEVSTGRLSSTNGQNWIDLLEDRIEINASVRFASGSPAISQVAESIQVGGRNLLRNTGNFQNANHWAVYTNITQLLAENGHLKVKANTGNPRLKNTTYIPISEGDTFTISVEYISEVFIPRIAGKFSQTNGTGEVGSWEASIVEHKQIQGNRRKSIFVFKP